MFLISMVDGPDIYFVYYFVYFVNLFERKVISPINCRTMTARISTEGAYFSFEIFEEKIP